MNKIVTAFVCAFALLGFVQCWGNDGHQIVAQIAENYLTATAYQNMKPYLNGFSLANISTWLDDYKETTQGAWSEDIHFVNLPVNATEFHIQYCELQYTSGVGCAVTSIANYTGILYKQIAKKVVSKCVNESNSGVEPCPLAFVTHLIGDIHQPLHVAYAVDHGGNYVDIDFDNDCTNLHAVWDSRLLFMYEDDTDLDWAGIARVLTQELTEIPATAGNWSIALESNIWANESFQVTRTIPYNFQPGSVSPHSSWVHTPMPADPTSEKSLAELLKIQPKPISSCSSAYYVLTANYYYRTIPTVFEQLMKGGVRLATHLNLLFDPEFSPPLLIDPYQAY